MTKEEKEKYCFKWDKELLLGKSNFGEELSVDQYDDTQARTVPFPSDYTLAVFSDLVYQNYYFCLPDNWKVLTTATNTDIRNGYYGMALWHPKLCQVVVAHRGTDVYVPGAVLSDIQLGISDTFHTRQSQSAATFVYLISEEIRKKNSSKKFQLSITGHSLGAWLAQISTFTVKYFKLQNNKFVEDENYTTNIHPHTVVFESPGCKEALSSLAERFVPRYVNRRFANFNNLDMTVYLSKLNPINSIHHHVGTIYLLKSETHSIKEIVGLFDYKTHNIERSIVEDFKSGKYTSGKLLISYLLPSGWRTQKIKVRPANKAEYSLNVFTEDELDFVTDWNFISDSMNAQLYKKDKDIPPFTIDYEYNLIKVEDVTNLNKVIARIKYLHPTKDTILHLLKKDIHDYAYFEIFKLEAKYFQKNILKFHRCYFQDKYGLKRFLQSNNHDLLHILIDKNSTLESELETSIVNNVLMCLKKDDSALFDNYFVTDDNTFTIVNWNILTKAKNFLTKIIDKSKDKINLLIVECFEVHRRNENDVLKLLLKSGAKVVLISREDFVWLQGENIKKVSGFGSNVKFEYLTEESQQEFKRQPNLLLNGKSMSLNDIIGKKYIQDEVYEYLNKTVYTLLEFMLTPVIGPIKIDCPYNNPLQNVVFLDLYHEMNTSQFLSGINNDNRFLYFIEDKEGHDLLRSIDKENVKVYPNIEFEKECVHNSDKIVYFFKTKDGKLYLIKIFNKNLYVPRNIIHNRTVNQLILDPKNKDSDLYFFYGEESKYKSLYKSLDKKRKRHYRYVKTLKKGKAILENLEEPETGHLFKINEDGIEWICSQGNLNALRKYMKPNLNLCNETEINYQQITILSGEPGMGKSSTVGQLFLNFQQTHWVFAIPLRNSNFTDINDNIDFDLVAKFILTSCNANNIECLQYLLSYCLNHNTKLNIYLMFDGFDEISTREEKDKFIKIINFIKENSSVKILITTRKFASKTLENGLSIFESNYEMIGLETKMVDFFCNFQYSLWHLFKPDIRIDEIKIHIPSILESAQVIFGEDIAAFIGIPMQMRMIAETITLPEPFKTLEMALDDVLNLYEKYIDNYHNIYFRKTGICCTIKINEWLKECILTKLCSLAIVKLFNLNTKYIKESDIQELNKVGLIQSDQENININFEFLHDSVRDLLVAQALRLWLECQHVAIYYNWNLEQFIVSDFLKNGEYKEVRFFLNCYLKKYEVSENQLNVCRDKLLELLEEKPDLLLIDERRESIFHVCVNENLCYLLKHYLFRIIDYISKKELLSKRNSDLQTPLLLALRKYKSDLNDVENVFLVLLEELDRWNKSNLKTVLLATLFVYDVTENDFEKIKSYSDRYPDVIRAVNQIEENFKYTTLFLKSCKENNLDEVNNIADKFKNDKITKDYLISITNNKKETCLHLTTDKSIVEKLLKLGCDKNAQDSHGMTPLNRAIKNKETSIAVKLINKGAKNIPDYFGFTAFLHAAKHGNLDVLKLLNSKELTNVHIDERNKFGVTALMIAIKYGNESIVNHLLAKGADPCAIDKHGFTTIHYAVSGDTTTFINFLKQKGVNINTTNYNGLTPLLYSITKSKRNMIICLLDNGADVNIKSAGSISPLKLLIERKEDAIVNKILREEHIKIKDGGTIVRAAARISGLTTEEIDYINSLQSR